MHYKDEARAALALTFDFDAETLWLGRDPSDKRRKGALSQGTYGAKVGVPLILRLLRERGLKATFFVPGVVAEWHTDVCQTILADGHEIGHHGYLHEWIDPEQPEVEAEVLAKGLDALKKVLGVRPIGYRSPAWEISPQTIGLLLDNGFRYSTNLMDDLKPYRHKLGERVTDLVELPVSWMLDDAPFALYSIKPVGRVMAPPSHVLEIWQQEFKGIYEYGGAMTLTMHPQFTGRPSRLATLSAFLDYAIGFDHLWIAPCGEIANWWLANAER